MRAGVAFVFVASLGAAQAPTAEEVRDRLDAYLTRYQAELSTLVADERMSQHVGSTTAGNRRSLGERSESRLLESEVAFVGLPGDAGWLGFRRVVTVNGRPLKDAGPPLAQLLNGGYDDRDQAHLLLEQSASQNLGAPRTTNLPNLPLELLHPRNRHRFAYRHDGYEKIRDTRTMRLVLTEQSTPTIIQRPEGGDMNTQVTAWVEEATGRLIRAEVKTSDARIGVLQFSNVVWVDFKADAKLGLLVPAEMREEFFAGRYRSGNGSAKYTNYRRFTAAGRVVGPDLN